MVKEYEKKSGFLFDIQTKFLVPLTNTSIFQGDKRKIVKK